MLPDRVNECIGTHEHAAGKGSPQNTSYAAETLAASEGAHKPAAGGFGLLLARLPARSGLQGMLSSAEGWSRQHMDSISLQQSRLAWGATQDLRQMLASPPQHLQACSRWVVRIKSILPCATLSCPKLEHMQC